MRLLTKFHRLWQSKSNPPNFSIKTITNNLSNLKKKKGKAPESSNHLYSGPHPPPPLLPIQPQRLPDDDPEQAAQRAYQRQHQQNVRNKPAHHNGHQISQQLLLAALHLLLHLSSQRPPQTGKIKQWEIILRRINYF